MKKIVFSLICLLLCMALLPAQEFRATISGRVLDSSGAAVPGAKIEAVNISNNETASAVSDASGAYTIPFLRPGQFKITATANGFKTYNRENIQLLVGQIAGIDIPLEVGAVSESINVTAEAALLETQTASRVGVIDQRQVSEMPLNSRNPFMLGAMMSGVVFRGAAIWQRPFDNGAIAEWSVNGGRQSNNEFLMDGAPNNGQAGNNNIAYVPIVDAVQEFSVQQNSYDAQYGKTGGGVFNVILKSGGNQFHATGWEFLRRKFLDANSYQNNAVGVERSAHTLDQYGFQLSGPVYIPKVLKKDGPVKLFYMGSFENYREEWPQVVRSSYPYADMRNGDFSKLTTANGQPITIYDPIPTGYTANNDPIRAPFPNNTIPSHRISPVAKAVAAYMPIPNDPVSGVRYGTSNHNMPGYAAKDKFYNLILKFDWNLGDKHRTYFRHASNDRTEDRADNGIDNAIGTSGQQPFQRINDAYVWDWVSTLSPTLVLNIRASYNRFIEKGFGRANEGFDLTSLGLPASLVNTLPQPTYFGRWENEGYTQLGRYQGINTTNNYNLMGNVTKIAGAHTLKMGVDVRRIHFLVQDTGNILYFQGRTSWTQRLWNQGEASAGDAFASFLLGGVNGSVNYPLYPFNRQWYIAPYIQDDWKVSRRLTLNLGLRYDYNGPADEKWNRMNRGFASDAASPLRGQFSPEMTALYPQLNNLNGGFNFVSGESGESRMAGNRDMWKWQPRVGAAFQVNDRTVVRGGYGLYAMNPNNNWRQYAGFSENTPLVNSNDDGRTLIQGLLSNPYPTGFKEPSGSSLGYNTFVGRNNNWFNPTFRVPLYHSYSFGVQMQVTATSNLDFSYVGSKTSGANGERPFNIPSAEFRKRCNLQEGGDPNFCNAGVPNPFRGVEAFRGTNFFTAATVSRFQMNRPFPQFSGDLLEQGRNDSKIWYNSLQVNFTQRIAGGLTLQGNYTFSKMVERWGYNDPYNFVMQQGLYFNDRPHYIKFNTVYELPFGRGKKYGNSANGFVNALINGWTLSTYTQFSSGEPNNMPGSGMGGVQQNAVIQLKDPRTPGGRWTGDVDWKKHQVVGWNNCILRQFNDGSIAPQPHSIANGCSATDFSQYAWLQTADYAPRNTPSRSGQIRKQSLFNMDVAMSKTTNITERLRAQFGVEAFNLTNYYFYGRDSNFSTDPNDPNFGTLFPHLAWIGNGYPRQVQLRFKVLW